MFRICLLLAACCLFAADVTAQSGLPILRNYEKAFAAGTRDRSGKPGPNYWQNRAEYNIQVELNPQNRLITGSETVAYENNSPDTLKIIRFKLQADRYRKGRMRAWDVPASDVTENGVTINNLVLNGVAVPADRQARFTTFLDIRLDTPLPPKSRTTISMDWSYTLPADESAAREYAADSSVFFVPYWYPQVAVYDDIHGWADFPYTGLQEFYHDFADYYVTIRVPPNYMVWATGEWQNAGSVLQPDVLKKWQDAHSSDQVGAIFTENDLKTGTVFRPDNTGMFRYKATDVPDFVFAASNRYNWDATSVRVDAQTGRRTLVSAVYDTKSEDYYRVCRIAADGIHLMSTWLPGYPFPYPCLTVFNGNDGMEYPMFCNDASQGKRDPTGLTVHETAHTYFPFMMGINEQEYAWMDEGWASFFDFLLTDSLTAGPGGRVRGYDRVAGTDDDVPLMTRSRFLSNPAYRIASYTRPQAAYLTLLDLLGYETFHRCMTGYMDRWKSKHPVPYDFFHTWNDLSGQNLDWFWKPWFFEWGHPDLAVQSVEKAGKTYEIAIAKLGAQPVPVHLQVEYTDGSTETFHQTAAVWKNGASTFRQALPKGKSPKSVSLGGNTIPDTNAKNNTWPAK
ncbi:MAG: M1 family metallopeptidase [Saprospiraceae bacterium]|nr:M1 family metallopeptidase [Saprospiraceae bacterium]